MSQEIKKSNNLLKVKDQFQASLLFSFEAKLESTKKEYGDVFFIFQDKEKREAIIQNLHQNKLTINPKIFIDNFITVKRIIRQYTA